MLTLRGSFVQFLLFTFPYHATMLNDKNALHQTPVYKFWNVLTDVKALTDGVF